MTTAQINALAGEGAPAMQRADRQYAAAIDQIARAIFAHAAARAVSPAQALVEAADAVAAEILATSDLATRGVGEIRIQLQPAVLDGSAVQVSVSGTNMAVVFHPATPDAAALLQAHAPELAALLSERVPAWHASVAVRGEPGRRSRT